MDRIRLGICLEKTDGHSYVIRNIKHDDQFVFTLGDELIVWEKSSLKPIVTLFYSGFVSSFDIDEDHIYTRHGDEFVIWRRSDWTAQKVLRDVSPGISYGEICVDEKWMYTTYNQFLQKRDKSTLQLVSSAPLPPSRPRGFFQSMKLDDGSVYSLDSHANNLCKWNKESMVIEFDDGNSDYQSIFVDGDFLYAASYSYIVVINRSDFTRHSVLRELPAKVSCFTVRDGILFVGFRNGMVMIFDSNLDHKATLKLSDTDYITSIDVDESRMYIGFGISSFVVLDINSHEEILRITNVKQRISGFGMDEEYIYSCKRDGELTIWSKTGDAVHQIQATDRTDVLSLDDQFIYIGYGYKVKLITKKDWKARHELIINNTPISFLSRSSHLFAFAKNQVTVWNKIDCKQVTKISNEGLEELGYIEQNGELRVSKVSVLAVDLHSIYLGYGFDKDGSLLVWSRSSESFVERLDCGRSKSIGFDDESVFASLGYGKFMVWNKADFSHITTLDLKVSGEMFQDDAYVYVTDRDPTRGIAVINKKTWTHEETLNFSGEPVSNIESQDGFLRFIDWYGQQRYVTRGTWGIISKAETPWRDIPIGSVYTRAGGNLILLPTFDELKNIQEKWKRVFQYESPLVIVGQQSPTISIVESWYVKENLDTFNRYLHAVENLTG
ncbi:MAG: hypothetical protein ThorAB25_15680 [Candidatus Thorarchaeota archaeon AB_25]|nr:MAG: hypothetical protein ThorAB25_15680 [Candidatus Thorarchaeota archaeon AB_25]